MKRVLCILCAAVILFSLCTCSLADSGIISPVNFYYKNNKDNYQEKAIIAEIHEGYGYEKDLKELIQLYISGPYSKELINPFPVGCSIKSIVVNNKTVEITLNSNFARLSDTDMTVACACLTLTILEYTQRNRLIIVAVDSTGSTIYTVSMTREQLLLADKEYE